VFQTYRNAIKGAQTCTNNPPAQSTEPSKTDTKLATLLATNATTGLAKPKRNVPYMLATRVSPFGKLLKG
jgi:hypothetical protein